MAFRIVSSFRMQAVWSASPGPEPRVLATGEAVAYVASRSRKEEREVVVAVDLPNGTTLWRLDAGAEVSSGPRLIEGGDRTAP